MATSSSSVCRVYEMVIHDVIKKLKNDFENEGIDEQVLLDLQYVRVFCFGFPSVLH